MNHRRCAAVLMAAVAGLAQAQEPMTTPTRDGDHQRVRIATFNASLFGEAPGDLAERLRGRRDEQLKRIAAVLQVVRPDIVLINEFDYESSGKSAQDFVFNYLMRRQFGHDGIRYRFSHVGPVNTGVASPFDLDGNGSVGGAGDAWGYGAYPGQYGMLVLSRYPIDRDAVRSLRKFAWRDMPDALLPTRADGSPWYEEAALRLLPLPSKSFWDVPIRIGGTTVHLIASHPTPPAFDGAEHRNRRRNHDEIRLIADYVSGDASRSAYLYDDDGGRGGLAAGELFVIAGDLNADPYDGNSESRAITQLLHHRGIRVQPVPASEGGVESAHRLGGGNLAHYGDPAHDTAVFGDPPGNLRVDYVLPSVDLAVLGSGVYWPLSTDADAHLLDASDHRLVWVDVLVPATPLPAPRRIGPTRVY